MGGRLCGWIGVWMGELGSVDGWWMVGVQVDECVAVWPCGLWLCGCVADGCMDGLEKQHGNAALWPLAECLFWS